MIKDRRFLIGLGAGIMLGGLLLQLCLIGQRSIEPMSDTELHRAAEQAGYKLVPQQPASSNNK